MLFTPCPKIAIFRLAWAILGPELALLAHAGGRQRGQTVQCFLTMGHFILRRHLAISGDIFDFQLVGNIWCVETEDAAEHSTVQSLMMKKYLALTFSSAV